MDKKPTIQELEAILEEDDCPIEILPNGEVRAVEGRKPIKHKVTVHSIDILKPVTMRENLGSEYC